MPIRSIDTNLFLRFLTCDDPEKAARTKQLLERVQAGEVALQTCESVIAELVFVLASPNLYHLSRKEVRCLLLPLISLRGLKLPNRAVFRRALDLYANSPLDFVDTLMIAHMERLRIKEIYSYDRDFEQVPGVRRLEP